MAKPVRKKEGKRRSIQQLPLPLTRQNFIIMAVGIVVITLGYLAMLEGSVEGFLPLVASPILLVLGYCVIIPWGILHKKSSAPEKSDQSLSQQV
jgi:hypothetical protein